MPLRLTTGRFSTGISRRGMEGLGGTNAGPLAREGNAVAHDENRNKETSELNPSMVEAKEVWTTRSSWQPSATYDRTLRYLIPPPSKCHTASFRSHIALACAEWLSHEGTSQILRCDVCPGRSR